MRLFVGDDWAQDHHDVEVMDEAGRVLARKRLPEGAAGMTQLHGLRWFNPKTCQTQLLPHAAKWPASCQLSRWAIRARS